MNNAVRVLILFLIGLSMYITNKIRIALKVEMGWSCFVFCFASRMSFCILHFTTSYSMLCSCVGLAQLDRILKKINNRVIDIKDGKCKLFYFVFNFFFSSPSSMVIILHKTIPEVFFLNKY